MFAFIRNHKARQRANLRRRGFDYAAGRLLQDGSSVVELLEQQVDSSRCFGDCNEFDEGICDAIRKFERSLNK